MATVGELIRETLSWVHSFTGIREQVTYLTAPVNSTDLVLEVADGNRISRGLIEVDEELMLVEGVDANSVRIYPFGRGQEGSQATSHAAEAKVVNDPLFPVVNVLQAMKATVLQLHPDLFQVKAVEIDYHPARLAYELPADCDRVLQVTADIPGPTGLWPQVTRWRFEKGAASPYASGKVVEIYQPLVPGRKFRVVYAAPYGTPTSTTQDLADLGIQDSVQEVVLLGTAWRLTQTLEGQRLQMQSVEQLARQEAVPPGAATNLAKQIYAMYALRRDEERRRLLTLHPQQPHFTR